MRLNGQYRLVVRFDEEPDEVVVVLELVDYH